MKVVIDPVAAEEEDLLSLIDIVIGGVFVHANSVISDYKNVPFMRCWAEPGRFRYVRLDEGTTWSGRTEQASICKEKRLRLLEAEIHIISGLDRPKEKS